MHRYATAALLTLLVPFVDRAEDAEGACKYTHKPVVPFASTAYPNGSPHVDDGDGERKRRGVKWWLVELLTDVCFSEQEDLKRNEDSVLRRGHK